MKSEEAKKKWCSFSMVGMSVNHGYSVNRFDKGRID